MSTGKKIGIAAAVLLLGVIAVYFVFFWQDRELAPKALSPEEERTQREERLRQLPISEEAQLMTREEKKAILRDLPSSEQLTEEEKIKILEQFSVPRK